MSSGDENGDGNLLSSSKVSSADNALPSSPNSNLPIRLKPYANRNNREHDPNVVFEKMDTMAGWQWILNHPSALHQMIMNTSNRKGIVHCSNSREENEMELLYRTYISWMQNAAQHREISEADKCHKMYFEVSHWPDFSHWYDIEYKARFQTYKSWARVNQRYRYDALYVHKGRDEIREHHGKGCTILHKKGGKPWKSFSHEAVMTNEDLERNIHFNKKLRNEISGSAAASSSRFTPASRITPASSSSSGGVAPALATSYASVASSAASTTTLVSMQNLPMTVLKNMKVESVKRLQSECANRQMQGLPCTLAEVLDNEKIEIASSLFISSLYNEKSFWPVQPPSATEPGYTEGVRIMMTWSVKLFCENMLHIIDSSAAQAPEGSTVFQQLSLAMSEIRLIFSRDKQGRVLFRHQAVIDMTTKFTELNFRLKIDAENTVTQGELHQVFKTWMRAADKPTKAMKGQPFLGLNVMRDVQREYEQDQNLVYSYLSFKHFTTDVAMKFNARITLLVQAELLLGRDDSLGGAYIGGDYAKGDSDRDSDKKKARSNAPRDKGGKPPKKARQDDNANTIVRETVGIAARTGTRTVTAPNASSIIQTSI